LFELFEKCPCPASGESLKLFTTEIGHENLLEDVWLVGHTG